MAAHSSLAARVGRNVPASTAAAAGSVLLGSPAVIAPPPPVAGIAAADDMVGWTVAGQAGVSDDERRRIRNSPAARVLANAQLKSWYDHQFANSAAIKDAEITRDNKELVRCCWAYVSKSGKVLTVDAFNRPSSDAEKKAVVSHHAAEAGSSPAKLTICAEDVLFHEHPGLVEWTICSVAFSFTANAQKPACSRDNGGCKKRLRTARIHEPRIVSSN